MYDTARYCTERYPKAESYGTCNWCLRADQGSDGGGGGAAAASNGGGVERRLRSSAASASWASHLPLEVGTRVMCRWRDQKLHPVKVIERRKSSTSSSPADYEYYVHYTECKRPRPQQDASFLGLGLGCFRLRESGA